MSDNRRGASKRDDDFGKDHGLIHEAMQTLKKHGMGRDFWSLLAHNARFLSKIKKLFVQFAQEKMFFHDLQEMSNVQCCGFNEIGQFFGGNFSDDFKRKFDRLPWPEASFEDSLTYVVVFCKGTPTLLGTLNDLNIVTKKYEIVYSESVEATLGKMELEQKWIKLPLRIKFKTSRDFNKLYGKETCLLTVSELIYCILASRNDFLMRFRFLCKDHLTVETKENGDKLMFVIRDIRQILKDNDQDNIYALY